MPFMSFSTKTCDDCEPKAHSHHHHNRQSARSVSPRRHSHSKRGKQNKTFDPNVDWTDLGDRIEDWFETAKTPGIFKLIFLYFNKLIKCIRHLRSKSCL